ncbi:MAG: hypothetical protein ACPG19_00620 [Saprospiraceae bacterium]
MKYIIIILGVLACSNLFGQIENYLDYQKQINQAELSLVRGNKKAAFDFYYTALQKSNGNFTKDVYNALLLSSELSEDDAFFTFLDLLIPKGLKNTYLNKYFEEYHDDVRWKDFLKRNKNHVLIKKELKIKMDSLTIKDQFFRIKKGSYDVYGDTINKIDSLNMNFLFDLVVTNQFPGENEIGVRNFAGGQGYDIVFHHYTQGTSLDDKKLKITPLLVNLVLEGRILPNKASLWLELQNGEYSAGVFDILNFKVNDVVSDWYISKYTDRKKVIINEYRKWLGMETLDEYCEKFLFSVNTPKAKYIFDIQRSTHHMDEAMFNEFVPYLEKLKKN